MAVNNATILDQIWLEGTNDYQQRVPKATQKDIRGNQILNVESVRDAIFDPSNKNIFNQFVDALVNRIGKVVINQRRWENPLAPFKGEMLQFGDTIEEIGNQLVKAHGYNLTSEDLLKISRPESKVAYHTVNREDKYQITVNYTELRKAFLSDTGLNDYINSILDIPFTSDNYDEFQIMKQLFAEYETNSGFFKVNVLGTDDEAGAKDLLKNIRTVTGKMSFLSSQYNVGAIPTFSNPEDLILFATPEVIANIDINALAGAFNVSYADVNTRVVKVDEFPIPNVQAILVDKDWFKCGDYVYENTSFYNPETLNTSYWLHHWGVYSVSPFQNAVLFTTDPATTPVVITQDVTGLDVSITDGDNVTVTAVEKGKSYNLIADLIGTITPANANITVQPDSVTWVATINGVQTNAVIDYSSNANGLAFYVKKSRSIVSGDTLEIVCTATYTNPSGATNTYSATASATIA